MCIIVLSSLYYKLNIKHKRHFFNCPINMQLAVSTKNIIKSTKPLHFFGVPLPLAYPHRNIVKITWHLINFNFLRFVLHKWIQQTSKKYKASFLSVFTTREKCVLMYMLTNAKTSDLPSIIKKKLLFSTRKLICWYKFIVLKFILCSSKLNSNIDKTYAKRVKKGKKYLIN